MIKARRGEGNENQEKRQIERARELSDLPDMKTNAKEGEGNQSLLRLRTL